MLEWLEKKYILGEHQRGTKKFQRPMAYRCKDVRMWKYFLRSIQPRHYLINKVVKFDLKYFNDANVDTIVPMNYAYFAFEKTIYRFFNAKKQKFYAIGMLEKCFERLLSTLPQSNVECCDGYSVQVHWKGDTNMLLSRKRYMWMLQRGKSVGVEWVEIRC